LFGLLPPNMFTHIFLYNFTGGIIIIQQMTVGVVPMLTIISSRI